MEITNMNRISGKKLLHVHPIIFYFHFYSNFNYYTLKFQVKYILPWDTFEFAQSYLGNLLSSS